MKALNIQANKSGKRYALVQNGDTYGVYAECSNYSRHVRGGIEKTWRYCEKGLNKDTAIALMTKKLSGKAK